MLVLHVIMWRRRWLHKRRNKCMHLKNIKRPEFGIFSHLSWTCLKKKKRNFMVFLVWTLSNPTFCHRWWEKKYESKTPTTRGRFHLKNNLQFFWDMCYKNL